MAVECGAHQGMHVLEDTCIVEVVDETGKPVSNGTPGRALVTNLVNLTQPLIRYQTGDLVTMSAAPCSCGRPQKVLSEVSGRQMEAMTMEGVDGQDVEIHPSVFMNGIEVFAGVQQFQVVQEWEQVKVLVVPVAGAERSSLQRMICDGVTTALRRAGVPRAKVRVELVESIERERGAGKKFLLIKALPRSERPPYASRPALGESTQQT
jgi:phenylacetate-coenzyme A ligase PaaK-like adenylate-forming protein